MKFTNIKLADGKSGARPGQGLKRARDHYVASSHYGIGTTANGNLNEDYYIVWNEWPTMDSEGSNENGTHSQSGTALADIGITTLTTALKATHDSGTLDCVIIRKSDRKAVRLQITGSTVSHYKTINSSNSSTTITAVDPKDGPWTPEIGRLVNMGYIG